MQLGGFPFLSLIQLCETLFIYVTVVAYELNATQHCQFLMSQHCHLVVIVMYYHIAPIIMRPIIYNEWMPGGITPAQDDRQ